MDEQSITKICIHCYIYGRVQGVGFRYYVKRQAVEYEITGWVKNLFDGTVEVLACGDNNNVDQFIACLKQGPMSAEVTEIVCKKQRWQQFINFSIIN